MLIENCKSRMKKTILLLLVNLVYGEALSECPDEDMCCYETVCSPDKDEIYLPPNDSNSDWNCEKLGFLEIFK